MPEHPPITPDRQGFLGPALEIAMTHARIAVVGLSGGGSHIVQQLAHIGFLRYVLCDPQTIEDSNLHRLVGGRAQDVKNEVAKVAIAARMVREVRPTAQIIEVQDLWQSRPEALRCADLIFGCVDTFGARRELEVLSRRYRIPYIDIGMDVTAIDGHPPRMAGQVVLSAPDGPCMFCMGYLTNDLLTREAAKYGDVGGRPQVVWANGVLASTAVGMALDQLTGWSGSHEQARFMSFDGNAGTLQADPRWTYRKQCPCPHYPADDLGDPRSQPF